MTSVTHESDADADETDLQIVREAFATHGVTLAQISCKTGNGTYSCPSCERDNFRTGRTFSNHHTSAHNARVIPTIIGNDTWIAILKDLYRVKGLSPQRIANQLPSHMGRETVYTILRRADDAPTEDNNPTDTDSPSSNSYQWDDSARLEKNLRKMDPDQFDDLLKRRKGRGESPTS